MNIDYTCYASGKNEIYVPAQPRMSLEEAIIFRKELSNIISTAKRLQNNAFNNKKPDNGK